MSTVSSAVEFDDPTVPPFSRDEIPREIKMPKWVWRNVYILLRNSPNNCLSHQELVVEHSRRFRQSLGGKNLLAETSCPRLVNLICGLPFVEPLRVHGVWKYHLRPENSNITFSYRDKVDRMEPKNNKAKPKTESDESDLDEEMDDLYNGATTSAFDQMNNSLQSQSLDEKSSGNFKIPPQPSELMPSYGKMPEEMRNKIYKLLKQKKYQSGIELKAFKNEFTKFYSCSISNLRDCNMQEQEMFYVLQDIIEIIKDESDRLWLRARDPSEIKKIYHERSCAIFSLPEIFLQPKPDKNQQYMRGRSRGGGRGGAIASLQPQHYRIAPQPGNVVRRVDLSQVPDTVNNSPTGWIVPKYPPSIPEPEPQSNVSAESLQLVPDQSEPLITLQPPQNMTGTFQNIVPLSKPAVVVKQPNFLQPPMDDSSTVHHSQSSPAFLDFTLSTSNGNAFGYGPAPTMTVNTVALNRLVKSNLRTNNSMTSRQNNQFTTNELVEQTYCNVKQILAENLELKIKRCLAAYATQWVRCEDIRTIYADQYNGEIISLAESLAENLSEYLSSYPEHFAFNKEDLVKPRPDCNVQLDVPGLVQSLEEFGISSGEVFYGSYSKLRLLKDEVLDVLVSHVKENGDFFIHIRQMEDEFAHLEIDMNEFYENPFNNDKFGIFIDQVTQNMPVAVLHQTNSSSARNWRRAKVLNVKQDETFVQLVDLGICLWTNIDNVKMLKMTFVDGRVPPFAILCTLDGITPDLTKVRPSLAECISQLTTDARRSFAFVKSYRQDDVASVDLKCHYMDKSHCSLREQLIARQMARASSHAEKIAPLNDLNDLGDGRSFRQPENWFLAAPNRFSDSDSLENDNLINAAENMKQLQQQAAMFDDEQPGPSRGSAPFRGPEIQQGPLKLPSETYFEPPGLKKNNNNNVLNDLDPDTRLVVQLLQQKINDESTSDLDRSYFKTEIHNLLSLVNMST